MQGGHDVQIQIEDDWETATARTTFSSGPEYSQPITAALLFGKDANGSLTVALATDKDERWTIEEITAALEVWAQDFAADPSYYYETGKEEE